MKENGIEKIAKKRHKLTAGLFIVSVILALIGLYLIYYRLYLGELPDINVFGMITDYSCLMVSTVFLAGCVIEKNTDYLIAQRYVFFLFTLVFASFTDFIIWTVEGSVSEVAVIISYVFNSLYYLANLSLIYRFVIYLCTVLDINNMYRRVYLLVMEIYYILFGILLVLNVKYHFVFNIIEGKYYREVLGDVDFIIVGLFLAAILPFMSQKKMDRVEKYVVLTYVFIPMLCTVLQMFFKGVPISSVGLLLSVSILYVHGHVRKANLVQLQQMELNIQQMELKNQQTAIMLSQIQPHFLFNALTSVAMLCTKDPEKAKKTTITFTRYLRANINSLTADVPIKFEQELSHTKAYVEIESIRFEDRLQVDYDITCTDFLIPALTLQPVTENAIKHGVCKKESGGRVMIRTSENDASYIVEVCDDGMGFDTDTIDWNSKTHIGMVNVRNRLKAQTGGDLIIESTIGKGTVSRIIIPK